ncbi:MAG: hypothetical protein COA57_00560 [Flavobacteriales bacterium]|nr:MAG: hypothetical protein COA57_00560 [Flavobacteriales bacterium]
MQGNIAIGTPTKIGGTNIYLGGDLEYYLKDNISIRGDFYYFLGSFGSTDVFKQNHSGYLGAMYHIPTNGHFDPYVGIQPGYVISQLKNPDVMTSDDYRAGSNFPVTVNPLFSACAGFNYYANRFFHLFMHVKYQTGKHYSDIETIPLNEVKIAFGLAYMIWWRKDHFAFRKPGMTKKDD